MKRFSFCWSEELGAAIREACPTEGYQMQLTRSDAPVVEAAVNQGIDSHLEACFVPDRGDSYEWANVPGKNEARLVCKVSPESLRVLARRLLESDDSGDEAGSLVSDICSTLDIELV